MTGPSLARTLITAKIATHAERASKFMLDLSQAAAKALGVHVGNRQVDVRVIALPGERPMEGDYDTMLSRAISPEGTGFEVPDLSAAAR